ncbi:mitochondrial ribosomal protein MRPL25 [Spathaspora passalidarum NRRL Y-27907]|uniref:Mitochondrial ribosomal protein MRPL25 n=1 Tax=Spathaspora passalidarum (strain NRRL Y-27907 / 11-Y1) TaxID=619300 RepID=G3AIB2_SPAPN|nr:mitochondrial ribosomal protein MRPL25 [Spathaspora passalidarum NRRL Y-27907]EGW33681.1 mitochondrial ribosomal protein MRPL25 [Spathaspora passalidarum NRRL Y-27907]
MSLTPQQAFKKLPAKLHNFFLRYPPRPYAQYAAGKSTIDDPQRNPFFPNKNTTNGRWYDATYSRRRSADLFKTAYKFGLQDLLPPMPRKFYQDKFDNKNWMRGVLHQKKQKWERELPAKLEARKEAIENMDAIILEKRPRYKRQLEKQQQKKKTWF